MGSGAMVDAQPASVYMARVTVNRFMVGSIGDVAPRW